MVKPAILKNQVSSGGVIFRRHNNAIEIAMVAIKKGNVWCLPKGLVDNNETPEETALREVSEETGLRGRIIEKLGKITYWYYIKEDNAKCRKTVYFFLMEYELGDFADHDWEVDTVSWFEIDKAIKQAKYKGEREMIKKAKDRLSGKSS